MSHWYAFQNLQEAIENLPAKLDVVIPQQKCFGLLMSRIHADKTDLQGYVKHLIKWLLNPQMCNSKNLLQRIMRASIRFTLDLNSLKSVSSRRHFFFTVRFDGNSVPETQSATVTLASCHCCRFC